MDNIRITTSHDGSRRFRDYGGQQHSRGSYKGGRGYRGHHGRQYDRPPHGGPRRLDDDVSMADAGNDAGSSSSSNRRFNPYNQRQKRYNRPRGASVPVEYLRNGVVERLGLPFNSDPKKDGSDWYKVIIPNGRKLEKDFILKSISSIAGVPFSPFHFHTEKNDAVFHVNGGAVAQAVRSTSHRITTPTGFKMEVFTRRDGPPPSPINEETVSKLKECMSKRYDVTCFSLNLSDLANDDDFKRDGIYLSMGRGPVVAKVLEIIGEHIPELKALDLSKNSLQDLENFSKLEDKAPRVQHLNLSKNLLKVERDLHVLSKLNLEELYLDGNPLCNKFADRQTYISAIRKRFPKVIKLDGNVLPPPITFDVEASTSIPSTKGSFFPNDHVRDIIGRFVEQYFTLYDSSDRQPLINAYHEQAMFSLAIQSGGPGKQPSFSDYTMKCRNFVRTRDNVQRQHRLKMGRVAIVGALSELPPSQHDPQSFVVDVGVSSPSMLSFTVNGVFKEVSNKTDKDVIRQFSRTFVVVPNGEGVAVTNEMLSLANILPENAKKYFQSPTLPQVSQPVAPAAMSAELKQKMVAAFALHSGMNENYSAMCLEQNNWDYDKAAAVFSDLKPKNAIPPEAFIK